MRHGHLIRLAIYRVQVPENLHRGAQVNIYGPTEILTLIYVPSQTLHPVTVQSGVLQRKVIVDQFHTLEKIVKELIVGTFVPHTTKVSLCGTISRSATTSLPSCNHVRSKS